jgi:hypothetical protein
VKQFLKETLPWEEEMYRDIGFRNLVWDIISIKSDPNHSLRAFDPALLGK